MGGWEVKEQRMATQKKQPTHPWLHLKLCLRKSVHCDLLKGMKDEDL